MGRDERFVLAHPKREGGWFVIERHVADHDFDPPVWVLAEEIGRFKSREDASMFMRARSERS